MSGKLLIYDLSYRLKSANESPTGQSKDVLDNMAAIKIFLVLLLLSNSFITSMGGPFTSVVCFSGCGLTVAACFTAAGAVFGTVPAAAIAAAPALATCNSAFGSCMAACALMLAAPTP